jgi:hypothetical protein
VKREGESTGKGKVSDKWERKKEQSERGREERGSEREK